MVAVRMADRVGHIFLLETGGAAILPMNSSFHVDLLDCVCRIAPRKAAR